jgi:hypothetical protein
MTSEGAGILIVEDEPELVRALRINLRARRGRGRLRDTLRLTLTATFPVIGHTRFARYSAGPTLGD